MKKYLSMAVITVLALSSLASLGQVAYAHDRNEGDSSNNNRGSAVSGFFRLGAGLFNNGNHNGIFNNGLHKGEKNNEDRNDNDNDNDDNGRNHSTTTISNLPRAINGVAKITAISGNTVTAVTTFGSLSKTWTITTDANTTFTNRTGSTSAISSLNVGDLILFTGTLTSKTDSSLSVTASKIRVYGDVDLSAKVVATGTISSIDSANTKFAIVGSDGSTTTVNVADLTRINDANNNVSLFANLATGMKVTVVGFWNSLKNIITAVRVKIM